MINLKNRRNIFWDFDGVLMDSMLVRNRGFELVLKDYPKDQVDNLMKFHLKNGGLSRYVKFRYFFEEIRNEQVSDEEVNKWATKFSKIMKRELLDKNLLINDSLNFVKSQKDFYDMHIVSGSDQDELRYLCKKLDIASFFLTINGSPISKKQLVSNLIRKYNYNKVDCILIGDSINDFEAAYSNEVDFMGYNNSELKNLNSNYINHFSEI